jgi:cytoskeletal protein CcmA (bactofilin family)
MIILSFLAYAVFSIPLSAEQKSITVEGTTQDPAWLSHIPSEYRQYIPKNLGTHKDINDSWEKYVPKQGNNPITPVDDGFKIETDDTHLLEGDQESFSFQRDHKGPARLFQCSFRKDFAVNRLDARQCSFQNLLVRGPAKIHESSVRGDARVQGNLSAHSLNVQGNMDITGPTIRLRNSNIQGDLLISDSVDTPATLYLENGTVAGNIHFKSGKGTLLTKGKAMMDGQITGVSS